MIMQVDFSSIMFIYSNMPIYAQKEPSMFLKKSSLLFLAIVPFLLLNAIPAQASDITDNLVSIYQDAEKSDPALARARAGLETAKTEKPLARSRLLPRITANGQVARRYNKLEGIQPDTLKKYYWGGDYTVALTQPVFDGQAWVSMKIAEDIISAGEAELMSARQDLILRTFEAYFNFLHARADVQVAEKQRDLLKSILDQTETFLKVGTGDITAVKEAQARYDASQSQLITAQNRFTIARQDLELLVHRQISSVKDLGPITARLPDPDNMEKWVEAALSNQPLLISAKKRLEAAEKKVEYARRERWPRLDLQASGGYMNGGYFPEMRTTHTEAGIIMTIPLYLGGSIFAKTAQAESQAIESRHNLKRLEDQVTIRAQSAFLRLRDSVAWYQAARQAMESAKVSMEATNTGFRVGTRTAIDALDLTQFYIAKKRDYLVALYEHVLARARLKAAAGVIGPEDIEAVNGLLAAD